MVAKNDLKLIRSLHQKKYRTRHGLFLAEGVKVVSELLEGGLEPYRIYSTEPDLLAGAEAVTGAELQKMSALVQPNRTLGVFHIPELHPPAWSGWVLALDGVRDPGNLGTLIRLCDWFGIRELVCSPDTVDCFNPKVLQATMGSLARVGVHYLPLEEVLPQSGLPLFGASMEGAPAASVTLPDKGVLVLGSESHGVSAPVRTLLDQVVCVPAFGQAESLNVATAGAILLYEIKRKA